MRLSRIQFFHRTLDVTFGWSFRFSSKMVEENFIKVSEKLCHESRFFTNDDGWSVVKEGSAEILFPSAKDVFYNPVQEFNRDLTVAVIKKFTGEKLAEPPIKHKRDAKRSKHKEENNGCDSGEEKGVTVLEALAASGLRSVRFAKEIPGLKKVVANDFSQQAVESIKRNAAHNKVEDILQPNFGDASLLMYQHKSLQTRFDVIDLDPYGSPTPFLDAAVQSVADGGLLCITATDMAVLCGNTPETCYTKYGAISLKTKACHEFALRILLQSIESAANRYGRYIEPLLTLSVDFYARVFLKVHTSQAKCKLTTSKLGYVYQCTGCEALSYHRLGKATPHENGKNMKLSLVTGPPVGKTCEECNSPFHIGGPIWLNPIHNKQFIEELLLSIQENEYATEERIIGMLSVACEELEDVPLYYELPRLTCIVKQSQHKLTRYTSAILNAGYKFSISHANRHGLKTTAPLTFLWDMLRTQAKQDEKDPLKNLHPDSPGYKIMSKEPTALIDFTPHPQANPESREKNLRRFQINPEPNWGPKARSKTSFIPEENRKKIENQDRKSRRAVARAGKKRKLEREQSVNNQTDPQH